MKFKLFLLPFLALFAVSASAELTVVTVDMNKALRSYYKTAEAIEKIATTTEQAQEDLQALQDEARGIAEELQELQERAQNEALSEEARQEAATQFETKRAGYQSKLQELQQFRDNTQQSLMQRQQSFRQVMFEEIGEVAREIMREREGDLLINLQEDPTPGATVLYANAEYDITEDVISTLNADAPEGFDPSQVESRLRELGSAQ